MAKRDRRSRALLRGLRKQARKGNLTARERDLLLDQEKKFRKARRRNAPAVGAGLAGAAALLGTSAGQAMLENIGGGIRGLRQDALGARQDRKTFREQSQQERDLMAAETEQEIADMKREELERAEAQAKKEQVFDEMRSAAKDNPALAATLGMETESEEGPTTFDDIEKNTEPMVKEDPYREGREAFESVQPELERLREEERRRRLAASMNEGRYGGANIDRISDIFEASRQGSTVDVPVYDDDGNVVGQKAVELDELSTAESMLEDLDGAVGERSLSEDDLDRVMDHARRMRTDRLEPLPVSSTLLERNVLSPSPVGRLGDYEAGRRAFESVQPEIEALRAEEIARDRGFESAQAMNDFYNNLYAEGEADMKEAERERAAERYSNIDYNANPRIERSRDLGARVQAAGGVSPMINDLRKKIARKYGIK